MVNQIKAVPPMNVTPIDLLPKSLKLVREQARRQFVVLLGSLFENADDALFELADRSSNNADQNMYFDSMREVRIRREGMESKFQQAIQSAFRSLYQPESQPQGTAEESDSALSLIGDDELEEDVAFRGMAEKIRSRYSNQIDALTKRIESLVRSKTIDEKNNPLGPEAICNAFRSASSELHLEIRAKLVVYKLFDKYVLSELEVLYQGANDILMQQGILPDLKAGKPKAIRRPGPPAAGKRSDLKEDGQDQFDHQDSADNQEVFDMLQNLLAQSRSGGGSRSSAVPVVDSGPKLAVQDLVRLLSTLQTQNGGAADWNDGRVHKVDVYQALSGVLKQSEKPQAIGRMDDDIINLVSMLFEFILDDHHLPTPMKALLARLQIPMLKVAVLDKTFFTRGGHPARKLLNELATAALGWSETQDLTRDPLYKKVELVVGRILNDFVDDVSLFQELLDEFSEFAVAENRRAQLIEQRTRNAEEGLGVSQHARAVVGHTLNQKAADKNLPKVVVEILREAMSNYMFLVYVKEGPDSAPWQEALDTVDDLIWSVSVEPDSSDRSRLLKLIPSLLQRLRKSFSSVSYNKNKMRQMLKDLESIHLDCLRNKGRAPAPSVISKDSLDSITEGLAQIDDAAAGSEGIKAEAPASMVESPVIIDNLPEPRQERVEIDDSDASIAETVNALGAGTWVEFQANQEDKLRAKLAAVIKATGKYIFVNRVGMKVAEKTRGDLVADMKQGSLRILDNAQIFDRALENVIGHLREMKH